MANKYVVAFLNDPMFVKQIDALVGKWFSKSRRTFHSVAIFEKEDLSQEAWKAMLESDIIRSKAFAYVVAEDKIRRLCRKGNERRGLIEEVRFSDISGNSEDVDNYLYQHKVRNRYDALA